MKRADAEVAISPCEDFDGGRFGFLLLEVGVDDLAVVDDEIGIEIGAFELDGDRAFAGAEDLDHFDEAHIVQVAVDAFGGGGTGADAIEDTADFEGDDFDVLWPGIPVFGAQLEGLLDEIGVGGGVDDEGNVTEGPVVLNGSEQVEGGGVVGKNVGGKDQADGLGAELVEGFGNRADGEDLVVVVLETEFEDVEFLKVWIHNEDGLLEEAHGIDGALVFPYVDEGFEGVGVKDAGGLATHPVEDFAFIRKLLGVVAAKCVVGVHDSEDAGTEGGRRNQGVIEFGPGWSVFGGGGEKVVDGIGKRDVGDQVEGRAERRGKKGLVVCKCWLADPLISLNRTEIVKVGGKRQGIEIAAIHAKSLGDHPAVFSNRLGMTASIGMGSFQQGK